MHMHVALFLNKKLEEIRKRNPRYSVRAFAKKVEISSGRVSELLNGQRPLNRYYADKIIKALKLNEDEISVLEALITSSGRKVFLKHQLLEHELQLLSSWEHYAILNLLNLEDFKSDPIWMSKRLAISVERVLQSLDTLTALEMLKFEKGRYVRTTPTLTTTHDIPSEALRKSLAIDIKKSLEALETTPVKKRDFSAVTFAINPDNLPKAKELIDNFQQRMSLLLEDGPRKEVYNLNIQLYPVTIPSQERQ